MNAVIQFFASARLKIWLLAFGIAPVVLYLSNNFVCSSVGLLAIPFAPLLWIVTGLQAGKARPQAIASTALVSLVIYLFDALLTFLLILAPLYLVPNFPGDLAVLVYLDVLVFVPLFFVGMGVIAALLITIVGLITETFGQRQTITTE